MYIHTCIFFGNMCVYIYPIDTFWNDVMKLTPICLFITSYKYKWLE